MSCEFGGKWLDDLNNHGLNKDFSGSDLSCAVLAGALLDDRLKTLLEKYFLAPQNPKRDRLFGRLGSLESFSARIEVARRLNLISEGTRKALDWIREIRNLAAHETGFTFDQNAVEHRVRNVITELSVEGPVTDLLNAPYDDVKGHFAAAVIYLVVNLQIEADNTNQTTHEPIDALSDSEFFDASPLKE